MAAGDRRKNGKPKDIVRRLSDNLEGIICKTKNYRYKTKDKEDVTCIRCMKLINK